MRAEQPAMSGPSTGAAAGTTASSRSAIARTADAAGPVVVEGDRAPGVAAGRHRRLERHLAEQRHADLVGERLPTAGAEQRHRRAVLAREVGHVLDHADDPHEAAPGHVGRPLGDLLGGAARAS